MEPNQANTNQPNPNERTKDDGSASSDAAPTAGGNGGTGYGAAFRVPSRATTAAGAGAGPARGGSSSRAGRPPNINENSLQRRLECVLAVESGQMTMADACAAYDISSRTFYRWLRSKPRLIELTAVKSEEPRVEELQSVQPQQHVGAPNPDGGGGVAAVTAAAAVQVRPAKRPRYTPDETSRTRIEVVSGRRKTVLNWYPGAKSEDIRAAISRRFAIENNRWFLNNADNEEVVLSNGMPSGRYHLVPFDELQPQRN